MKAQFQITLQGAGIPSFVPVGASVSYGINRIPTATVHLEPRALALMCDFEKIRRKSVVLTIKGEDTCIRFNGVIDGQSISQQPGGLTTALTLKHNFVFLNETYPRILGLSAGSSDVFAINKPVTTLINKMYTGGPESIDTMRSVLADVQQVYGYERVGLSFNLNVIDFAVELAKAVVLSQYNGTSVFPTNYWAKQRGALSRAMEGTNINQRAMAPVVLNLLKNFDTSYCSDMAFFAKDVIGADRLIKDLGMLQDTVLQNIIRQVSEYGACLVIGNNHAYVVPDAAYLKVPKRARIARGATGSDYNVVYPAEYENFTFNDAGENTIKGVYLVEDPNRSVNISNSISTAWEGCYIDPAPNIMGNVVVKPLPDYATAANLYIAGAGSAGIRNKIHNGAKLVTGKVKFNEYQSAFKSVQSAIDNGVVKQMHQFLDDYAQMEYCKLKFNDRGGQINTYFTNIFAPGSVGSLYTREPGTYIDMFVTGVTHSFSTNGTSGGSANTSVTFRGGRMGNSANTGLDRIDLYNYTYADAQSFCSSFVTDISS